MTSDEIEERDRIIAEMDGNRCPVCGWPFARSANEGCVPDNCSMRPPPPPGVDGRDLLIQELRVTLGGCDEMVRELQRKLADSIHAHNATKKVLRGEITGEYEDMTKDEIDASLREAGLDLEQVQREGEEFIKREMDALKARIEAAK